MFPIPTGGWRHLTAILLCLGLAACNEPAAEAPAGPVAFHPDDECHVCGMVISELPGPKGEAVEASGAVKKFCSVQEMFVWWLQPENRNLNVTLYVHDMTRSEWNRPDDSHLIDAKKAYYVVGSDLKGAMGVTLASFADRLAAEGMATARGGQVLRWDEIGLEQLQMMHTGNDGHAGHSGHGTAH
ncbi:nitrous oxide reductase accessory protein NosL [Pseudomonas indica]|uniref:nitrous oxide reductase accessory protein NosL n=1 Tax=Pseudomonas indica TaxID=137658 RepID=UPI000BAB6486|nr:nitrous oxide reductase accessory protein NosL [Pseudomonas indica]PAU58637.1 NosL protein [Pseudomonas indica]